MWKGERGPRGDPGHVGDTGAPGQDSGINWAILKYLMVGIAIFAVGIGFVLWRQSSLVEAQRDLAVVAKQLAETQADAAYRECQNRNSTELVNRDIFTRMALLEKNLKKYPVPTPGAAEFRAARARLFSERGDEVPPLPPCEKPASYDKRNPR